MVDPLANTHAFLQVPVVHGHIGTCFLAAAILLSTSHALAQTAAPGPSASKRAPLANAVSIAPNWNELTPSQRDVLRPLAKLWDSLSVLHRRKWIALTPTYAGLSPENKEKMQARMVEWAALSPREREVARLNFVEAKKVPPSDRAAGWEAYQALSPQERQKLASQAPPKPAGAAVAAKPVAPNKLAVVPVTRHTPEEVRKEAISRQGIDQKTLLPQAPRAAVVASEPAPASEVPAPAEPVPVE